MAPSVPSLSGSAEDNGIIYEASFSRTTLSIERAGENGMFIKASFLTKNTPKYMIFIEELEENVITDRDTRSLSNMNPVGFFGSVSKEARLSETLESGTGIGLGTQ